MKIPTTILTILSSSALGLLTAGCNDNEADLCDEFVVQGQFLDEEPGAAALALDDALALAEETSGHLELELWRTAEAWRCVDETTIDAVPWEAFEWTVVPMDDAEHALNAYMTSLELQPRAVILRTRPVDADGEPIDLAWSEWTLLRAGPCDAQPDLATDVPDDGPTEAPAS